MDAKGHTLTQRVTAVLRARQYVVFYAIGLYAFGFAVTLTSAWLYRHRPIGELLDDARSPLIDAVAGRSASIMLLFLAYIAVSTWLRAGYIRSLNGDFHLRPRDAGQFLRLLALNAVLAVVYAIGSAVMVWGSQAATAGNVAAALAAAVLMVISLAALYADYIVVLAGLGPLAAVVRSTRVLATAFGGSVIVLLVVTLLGNPNGALLSSVAQASLPRAMPIMVVWTVALGGVLFVADVVLLVFYLGSPARGELEPESG